MNLGGAGLVECMVGVLPGRWAWGHCGLGHLGAAGPVGHMAGDLLG
jgi:hypothetical protein